MRKPGSRFPLSLDQVKAGPARPREGSALTPASPQGVLRPQRLLHEAAKDAARSQAPSGLGLDSQAVRSRMVARLQADGLHCEPVLQALAAVPRHQFVDTALAIQAYEDTSLPIGLGQTISKPSVVGRMLALLFESESALARGHLGRALEIGTGCGYQAAVLSLLCTQLTSLERLRPLHDKASAHLQGWPHGDVRLLYGDGREGHAARAPFDSIVAAAGGDDLPPAWVDQLAPGGRLVAPMHNAAAGGQVLLVVDRRRDGQLHRRLLDAVHFVPLKSGVA
jgi:protein-L-isoaspartate(D-aspartate) O-methyltransferase